MRVLLKKCFDEGIIAPSRGTSESLEKLLSQSQPSPRSAGNPNRLWRPEELKIRMPQIRQTRNKTCFWKKVFSNIRKKVSDEILFHPDAKLSSIRAVQYYEAIPAGLGS